jgi:general stress protein 26
MTQPQHQRGRADPDANDVEELHSALKPLKTVILLTPERGEDGPLHGRPMSVARLDDDSSVWFVTGIQTPKIDEVIGASQDSLHHVVMRGRTRVVRDRSTIDALWAPAMKVYFPNGKDDPEICALHFVPTEAEYWDLSGTKGVRYLVEATRALLTGEPPRRREESETHGEVHRR